MEKKIRLTQSSEIMRVRQSGKSYPHPYFVLIVLRETEQESVLICVIATKSVGGAVDRNRAKRCIRAAVDSFSVRISTDAKMILVARKAVLSASADEINHALEKLLKKAACLAS